MKPFSIPFLVKSFTVLALFLVGMNTLPAQPHQVPASFEVHLSPSTPFLIPVRWSGGVGYDTGKRFGYSLDAGYGSEALNTPRFRDLAPDGRYRFKELRAEARYYKRDASGYHPYVGLEVFYTQTEAALANGIYEQDGTGGMLSFERADFQRNQWGIHLLAGHQFPIYKRFFANIIFGIGGVSRFVTYRNVENPAPSEVRPRGYIVGDPLREGRSDDIHGVFRVRLGYFFPVRKTD
ncbi:MAG: hypothetical protein KF852_08640 [Saprospiraceae bacterium]|nr:hypothetical protein [Saprospiraceae bacterium]